MEGEEGVCRYLALLCVVMHSTIVVRILFSSTQIKVRNSWELIKDGGVQG